MVAPSRLVLECSVEKKKVLHNAERGEKSRRWLASEEADGGFLYSEKVISMTR